MAALTKATTLVAVLLMTIGAIIARDIPEFLHICNTNDPQYNDCILESIESLRPSLHTGVPEYNIPSLEPLTLKELKFSMINNLRIKATDIDVTGSSNFIVRNVVIDTDRLFYTVDIALPNISIDGKYDVNGKLLLLQVRGSGDVRGNFQDCTGLVEVQGEKYIDEDGVEKLRIADFKLKITVSKGTLHLDNLFDGEKVLGDVVNQTINNHFQIFLQQLKPVVEKSLSDAFQNIADNIVQQFSYDQLFPSS